jgi:hypothetical protein
MILTFYCDDTNPYDAPPTAFKTFLDFAASEGIAGEASIILGYGWEQHGLISRSESDIHSAYFEQLQRAYSCGIDSQFELMTHGGLFDFKQERIPEGAIHEGVWLIDPAVTVKEYETYFYNIISEGERIGVRFTGLTQPGCNCEDCKRRYIELQKADNDPNPNLWQALLNLAMLGKFRGTSVPCFFGGALEHATPRLMAVNGIFRIYDLPPNLDDHFGVWLNAAKYVNADYYISADGQKGRLVELARAGSPYAMFFCHWQGFNPANGVGWDAFTQVVRRVQKFMHNQVTWMRPSEYADRLR